ncbi:MAG: HAD-IA family hydrolase, partial [Clostridia bacterium]|nr:HAD-IA family hydrolase [Clostridia bacterium]
LASALEALKKRGARLAVVTTDNPEITEECLRVLGIYDLFDKIYTDDGKTPKKPNPSAALNFMELVGASPERTLMVGDTMTDVTFARRAGISVCALASSIKAREALLPRADAVISKISELVELTEGREEC